MTGYMFGKGVYFADMVSKSANYCCASYEKPRGLALLAEVALGNMYECTAAEYIEKLPKGFQSCKGLGGTEPNPEKDLTLENGCKGKSKLFKHRMSYLFQSPLAKELQVKRSKHRYCTMSTLSTTFLRSI